jgi:hypothetical protein
MEPRRITAKQARRSGRRLVLISQSVPASAAAAAPIRIIGSEPSFSGGFRLTDR